MARRLLLLLVVCACTAGFLTVSAQSFAGGAPAPSPGGGTSYAAPLARADGRRAAPVLRAFRVSPGKVLAGGSPTRFAFRIDGRGRSVRVAILLRREGRTALRVDLGRHPTRKRVLVGWDGAEAANLPAGRYALRLTAVDARGRRLRVRARAARAARLQIVPVPASAFPVAGPHDLGGPGSQFGADRPGHVHQGQDISAAEGTPVVAPLPGQIVVRAFQARGAGNHLVLRVPSQGRDMVFMHLQDGSMVVDEGAGVATGQRIAAVGSTGASSGAHLHFEIWEGPWQVGGHPIDPLPDLLRWKAGG